MDTRGNEIRLTTVLTNTKMEMIGQPRLDPETLETRTKGMLTTLVTRVLGIEDFGPNGNALGGFNVLARVAVNGLEERRCRGNWFLVGAEMFQMCRPSTPELSSLVGEPETTTGGGQQMSPNIGAVDAAGLPDT